MGVISQMADRVCVMYCGQVVEEGSIDTIFSEPKHPYNKALLDTVPSIEGDIDILEPIAGMVPMPQKYTKTCRFYERCKFRVDECSKIVPKMLRVARSEEHTSELQSRQY